MTTRIQAPPADRRITFTLKDVKAWVARKLGLPETMIFVELMESKVVDQTLDREEEERRRAAESAARLAAIKSGTYGFGRASKKQEDLAKKQAEMSHRKGASLLAGMSGRERAGLSASDRFQTSVTVSCHVGCTTTTVHVTVSCQMHCHVGSSHAECHVGLGCTHSVISDA